MRTKFFLTFLLVALAAPSVFADVEISGTALREYALPGGGFEIAGATVQTGANGATVLSNNSGEGDTAACTVVIATDMEAKAFNYQFEGNPTICSGVLPHPDGGVFIRGFNPTAMEGDVTGFTARIDGEGNEVWKVPDQLLVDASPEPAGSGEFLGGYVSPIGVMAYSAETDRLLAFTAGQLTIGQDVKIITQGHVLSGDQGVLSVSGQTFGQSGVGIPGAAVVRDDGKFIIYYYSPGARGAYYYIYNGRNEIDFLDPANEDWALRFVYRMVYANRSLHFIWTDADDPGAGSFLTVTNDEGALFFTNSYDPTYLFSDAETAILGPPNNIWVTDQYNVIAYVADGEVYLRFVDSNGESPGMGRLSTVSEDPPASIVEHDGQLRVLTYNELDRRVTEHALTFQDVAQFNPDAGLQDMGIPDLGLSDVLEEVTGCACRTVGTKTQTSLWALVMLGATAFWRRKRR